MCLQRKNNLLSGASGFVLGARSGFGCLKGAADNERGLGRQPQKRRFLASTLAYKY